MKVSKIGKEQTFFDKRQRFKIERTDENFANKLITIRVYYNDSIQPVFLYNNKELDVYKK